MEKKARFNLIDGLIVLVIIAAIAGAVFFFVVKGRTEEKRDISATYQIQLVERDKSTVDGFQNAYNKGEKAIIGLEEEVKAEIVDIKVEPARRNTTDMINGSAGLGEVPECYDITFTLKSDGVDTKDEVFIGQETSVRVGDGISVRAKGVAGYGYIISLDTAVKPGS